MVMPFCIFKTFTGFRAQIAVIPKSVATLSGIGISGAAIRTTNYWVGREC
jgi:hypothetical protein